MWHLLSVKNILNLHILKYDVYQRFYRNILHTLILDSEALSILWLKNVAAFKSEDTSTLAVRFIDPTRFLKNLSAFQRSYKEFYTFNKGTLFFVQKKSQNVSRIFRYVVEITKIILVEKKYIFGIYFHNKIHSYYNYPKTFNY